MNKKILVIVLAASLSGCSIFSPYGTDNTPAPAALTKYHATVAPHVVWGHDAGSGSDGYLRLKPAIAHQTIYNIDYRGILTATNTNGQRLWQKDFKAGGKSGIGSNGALIAFVDAKAILHVLNLEGKEQWQTALTDQALAPPTVLSNMVLTKTIDGNITAYDLTGKQLWQYQHEVPSLMLRASSSVLVSANTAYVGFSDGKVVALNLQNGNELWEQTAAEPQGFAEIERMVDIDANLILKNNRLFVATYQGKVSALNPQTGAIIWQQGNSVYAGIAADDSRLFAVAADGTLDAYDQASGKVLWEQKALAWRFLTGPVLFNNTVVVGDLQGYLHFLNPHNGELMGRIETYRGKDALITTPLVNQSQLISIDTKGYLTTVAI